jgi:plastocyanin
MKSRLRALPAPLLTILLAGLLVACAEDPTPPGVGTPPAEPGEAPAADVIVIDSLLGENRFEPEEVTAPAGTEVTIWFRNGSGVEHTLTFDDPIQGDTGVVPAGASGEITFTTPEPGRYRFVCTIHPGMEGELVVL